MPATLAKHENKLLRSGIARGLKTGLKTADGRDVKSIDPAGGGKGAGIIRDFAVITRGEALGHDRWIDSTFLDQVTERINLQSPKSRFTHPGLCGDGLGKHLGRVSYGHRDGDIVRADLHADPAARNAPDGDLAGYVMGLAESDPEAFGASISFLSDRKAEQDFQLAHGGRWHTDEDGYKTIIGFKSPDADNVENLPHVRLKELRAVDIVDDPAANPGGLFHRGDEMAAEAETLLSYVLGLTESETAPKLTAFDIDPERVKGFAQRFLQRHGLSLTHADQEAEMPAETSPAPAPAPAAQPAQLGTPSPGAAAGSGGAVPGAGVPASAGSGGAADLSAPAAPQQSASSAGHGKPAEAGTPTRKDEGKKFLDAYGARGATWFAEGHTFEEAAKLHVAAQAAEIEALKKEKAELSAKITAGRGEANPVSFSTADSEKKEELPAKAAELGTAAARYAAAIKVPGK